MSMPVTVRRGAKSQPPKMVTQLANVGCVITGPRLKWIATKDEDRCTCGPPGRGCLSNFPIDRRGPLPLVLHVIDPSHRGPEVPRTRNFRAEKVRKSNSGIDHLSPVQQASSTSGPT